MVKLYVQFLKRNMKNLKATNFRLWSPLKKGKEHKMKTSTIEYSDSVRFERE